MGNPEKIINGVYFSKATGMPIYKVYKMLKAKKIKGKMTTTGWSINSKEIEKFKNMVHAKKHKYRRIRPLPEHIRLKWEKEAKRKV